MTKAYCSNLTWQQWELIAAEFPFLFSSDINAELIDIPRCENQENDNCIK
ncbi:hypothetical protein H6G93_27265 [Nostoc sp. FACHB-973]|nr:hypothetical protein [Nostoc sp. FACHB-973]